MTTWEWIKIADKLPKEGQKVIYYFEYTGVGVGKFEQVDVSEVIGEKFKGHKMNVFYGT